MAVEDLDLVEHLYKSLYKFASMIVRISSLCVKSGIDVPLVCSVDQ